MRLVIVPICLLMTACAGSVDRISDMRDAAPEWYEARKQELAGEGYPKLSDVPVNTSYRTQQRSLRLVGADKDAVLAAFNADPRSEPSNLTPDAIEAWGRDIAQRLNAMERPANFLTNAEINSLRARFERPRARR